MPPYDALLLVSFGGPEKSEEVLPFLRRVSAGRAIPEERLLAVAEHYYQAGGTSPINARCRELLAALEPELAPLGLRLYWGNRNWEPLVADTVRHMRDDGVRHALALVTSAYGGYSSCRQYIDDIDRARAVVGDAPVIAKLRLFYNHPGWVEAWTASLQDALGRAGGPGAGTAVIFSAHSIPLSLSQTSPYAEHVHETARLVAEAVGLESWQLAWQSRSGNPAVPWLGPDISEVIQESSAKSVVVAPIGFVCENMEVVHDLDVEAAAQAAKVGARFIRAENVSGHPLFARMVLQLVEERLHGTAKLALGTQGPWGDHCPAGHCPQAPPVRAQNAKEPK